jgi:hypothetical protein
MNKAITAAPTICMGKRLSRKVAIKAIPTERTIPGKSFIVFIQHLAS